MAIHKFSSLSKIKIAQFSISVISYKNWYNNSGEFPKNVTTPISYGSNIEALVGCFHARQHIPFARMKETFNNVFNISISEGGIHCLLNRFAEKTTPVYQLIKERLCNSWVIGADETGAKVNGKKHWIWAWQTPNATYITHSDTRGKIIPVLI